MLEDRVSKSLRDMGTGNEFTDKMQTAWEVLQGVHSWDLIYWRAFACQKKSPAELWEDPQCGKQFRLSVPQTKDF